MKYFYTFSKTTEWIETKVWFIGILILTTLKKGTEYNREKFLTPKT